MGFGIIEAIEAYSDAVEKRQIRCSWSHCPRCGATACFKYHARRRRRFLVVVERMVRPVMSYLTRWKCLPCGETSTLYPTFALPRRHYVQQVVLRCSKRYIDDDTATYRRATTVDGMGVHYDTEGHETIDDRCLAHTTLHRWITWSSHLVETMRRALQLIRAKSATSVIHRVVVPIPVHKHRGELRRQRLRTCGRLLAVETEYRTLFRISLFTGLAPRCGWQ